MSDNKNVLIEVRDLCKSFDHVNVLNGISTTISQGEVVAIIGPSGCGKSTFLRSMNLLEKPTSGSILFEGTDITDSSVDINKMRQKIGMVFQQFNLFPNHTVKGNIMLAPVQTGLMDIIIPSSGSSVSTIISCKLYIYSSSLITFRKRLTSAHARLDSGKLRYPIWNT